MISKPINIIDEFGDYYLGCSKCKEPLYFSLVLNIRPNYCIKCGGKLDWSEADEKGKNN